MKSMRLSHLAVFILFIIFSTSLSDSLSAADYPQRGITIVVPWPAGSSTGITAQKIVSIINQNKLCPEAMQVVFKPGGAGTVGLAEVLRGNPDGYTLAYNPSAPIIVQPLVKDLPYSAKTLIPIIQTARFDWLLTVKGDAPWKTINEFLEYAKKRPGEVTVGTAGDYTWSHIALMHVSKATGLKFRHVPYGGSAPAVVALLGGHVDAAILLTGDVSTHIDAGKLRFLASTEPKRSIFYPNVTTFNEIGYATQGSYHTNIIVAPKGTPEKIIITLHDIFKKAIDTDDYKSFLKQIGGEHEYIGYKELPAKIDTETQKIIPLLEELGAAIKKPQ
jgi:tripartite-type tricarboxylate transporter receptor subunit TctC